ncbi:metallophosphoesterase family protein [Parapedobacter koreensis]|uniref:3',5'-cyclic AMP phosphodiesterase CpdA n=1 Tax=Parapedobacter koreensis TaxID=332977 RepID=A0A1H7FJU4_9SPHI|nr:metallophosphoesterase [Parapedobacter koreensis]SEK26373.1 3',5'-cyclic AMP phosphodiesterase CpdA [Parapedobacter koreensis]
MTNVRRTGPVFLRHIPDDAHLFKPLPHPTGLYPYRLNILDVLNHERERLAEEMSFHMIGDTGSVRHSAFQSLIATAMTRQAQADALTNERPAFLFHLGDIVYNHGEAREYAKQFFVPYEAYPGPIFAVAGNHDGDINPDSELIYQSLDAFMDVFCDTYPRKIIFGNGSKRLSMIQPNVYWALETPIAHFIGLYANVTKHGTITADQRDWFIEELRYADSLRPDRAVIVCIHHAPYSADTNHGSSPAMIAFLESAFKTAGVKPDVVFSGHVHNYQRFTKAYEDGTQLPYVVAGAGGYADLHPVAPIGDSRVEDVHPTIHQVRLENYCDDRYGFLKITIEKQEQGLQLVGEYYTLAQDAITREGTEAALFERFVVPLGRMAYSYC